MRNVLEPRLKGGKNSKEHITKEGKRKRVEIRRGHRQEAL